MRISKHSHDSIRQNGETVKKPQKHDVNLQKNSTLYFQVGLIVCLLITYGLFEMKFETTIHRYADLPLIEEPDYMVDVPIIKTEAPNFDEPLERKVVKSPVLKEVPDDTPDPTFFDESPKPKISNPIVAPDALPDLPEKPEDDNVPIAFIQNAPIYPGCEKAKTNEARKKCMSDKIAKLIQRKFHGDEIASEFGLKGMQKINVQFTIDKTGKVNSVKTRAPHPKLEDEAKRVINLIPEMTPGKQNNKNVGVIYILPIKFMVH
ncbi:energy transducer TonB [Aestuariivivens marinum]|uniref:energy transducer TonB n=1 Tax=Aestuariivivens marinum TaxID=2913555 RepID=UPI001F580D59|nr:energy transducer TonB [Aestuariivivens marinum]